MNFIKAEIVKYIYLLFGFFLVGLGINLIVNTPLGYDSWSVFHVGITLHTPFTLGQVSQIVGIVLIIIGWALKIKPGIGTFLNMYFVGFFVDLIANIGFITYVSSIPFSLIYILVGIFVFGIGCGIYINCDLGAGPRDALMLGLSRATGRSVSFARTTIEIFVVITGYFLGGIVGIGTILYALLIGHAIQWALKVFKLPKFVVRAQERRSVKANL